MIIAKQIEYDLEHIKTYYDLISMKFDESPEWSYLHSSARYNTVIDVYGCVEFWLKKICDMKMKAKDLKLSHKDIRGENAVAAFHKYLSKVAKLDMDEVEKQYSGLQELRKIRNIIVHAGAHVGDDNKIIQAVENIEGIHLFTTLVVVEARFIENAICNTKVYLAHASRA